MSDGCGGQGTGLLSVLHYPTHTGETLRTTDNGRTWNDVSGLPVAMTSFVFKDSKIGWASTNGPYPIYKTIDGGLNWSPTTFTARGQIWALAYSSSTSRLMVAESSDFYYSDDEGMTWGIINNNEYQGLSFSSPLNGIASGIYYSFNSYTKDGGLTWSQGSLLGEDYQPFGDPISGKFFAVSENGPNEDKLYISIDGGAMWNQIYQFSANDSLSGTVIGDLCHIYLQTGEGIMESTNQGLSWSAIGGPEHSHDIRMSISRGFLFAADQMLYTQDGTTSLWKYAFTYPLILSANTISTATCTSTDSTLFFSISGDCHNGILKSLGITGSNAYQMIQSPNLPDTLFAEDSVKIRYTPQNANPDTAYLMMSICTPAGIIDTSITLLGSGIRSSNIVYLSGVVSPSPAHAGDVVTLKVYPKSTVQHFALNTIDLSLQYNGDLLTETAVKTGIPGASVTPAPLSSMKNVSTLPIQITGTDLSLDPTTPLLELTFQTSLTDTISTEVLLSNIVINKADSTYRCTLGIADASPQFSLQLQCGDSTIQQFMREGNLSFIVQSITPNPTDGKLRIVLLRSTDDAIQYDLCDVLGGVVSSGLLAAGQPPPLRASANPRLATANQRLQKAGEYYLNFGTLPSGSYYLRLSTQNQVESRKIILAR